MLRVVSACIALIAGFAASSASAQSYPDGYGGGDYGGGDYGGGAPALIFPDGYGAPDNSHDSYGSSEAVPADIVAPDAAPDGEESHEGDEGGH